MVRELVPHRQVIPPAQIDDKYLAQVLQQHMHTLESMIKKMQRDIPVYVDEYLYSQNSTTLTLLPQSQNLELITCVIAVVTASGGGTLTIGGHTGGTRTIPLPQGNSIFMMGEKGMLLNNTDLRQVTQGTAGLLGLEMFGIELPDKAVF